MNTESSFKRIARHDVGPLDRWRSGLENVNRRREIILARAPLPSDGTELMQCDCDRAAIASLFDDSSQTVVEAFAAGAGAAAAAALCQSESSGAVELIEPGRPSRLIPTGNASLTPALWRDGFALACAARDRDAFAILCSPARIEACQLPSEQADAFWLPYCLALASIFVEPEKFSDYLDAAFARMDDARIAAPDVIAHIDRPMLELARALVNQDSDWDAAVARALESHRDYYATEENRFDHRGFLSFGITALCALAHEWGIETRVESPYMPMELVRGEKRAKLSVVTFIYPPRTIMRAEEAIWFLDLAGFPREGRSHRLIEDDDRLLARYEAKDAPFLPHARIDFVLADAADTADPARAMPPMALDAGELVWIAQGLATEAGDESLPAGRRRALLSEAIDCVNAALDRIAPGDDAAPADSIISVRGRSLYDSEPGRFRQARLIAYRDALAGLLQKLDDEIARGSEQSGDNAARASALASIELICGQVMPILQAIARDFTGEVFAQLKPREDDYARVFVGDAIGVARRAYEDLWSQGIRIKRPTQNQSEIRCFAAPAGMLADENELSKNFPSGYRAIARWLNPHLVWIAWKYVSPGQTSGLAFNGLVWCDDHWAWFPKPYRALAEELTSQQSGDEDDRAK